MSHGGDTGSIAGSARASATMRNSPVKIVFTPEADLQADELDTWWREHRPKARDLTRELVDVLELIADAPALGVEYRTRSGMLMPKTRTHVYFEVDRTRNLVTILAGWGAPRSKGPSL